MATWPAELPPPALNTLQESPPRNAIRSSMDKGPPKSRKRTSANVRPLAFNLNLTPEQVEIIDEFYIENESIRFVFTHPRTGATVEATFVEEPKYSEREGILYNVSVMLEILP